LPVAAYLSYDSKLDRQVPLTYMADIRTVTDRNLELRVDICLPSIMVKVRNPGAIASSRIWGINLVKSSAIMLLEGRCQLRADLTKGAT
jgi:hypothetical protein